mgnify:CR=1 FL=1
MARIGPTTSLPPRQLLMPNWLHDAASLPGGNRSSRGSNQSESSTDSQTLPPIGGRAGESAQQMHNRLRKDWLRRNRSIFLILAIILILIAAVANATFWLLGQPWMAGFFSGAVLIFWVLIRQNPPGWIENWQLGSWGEKQTAKELNKLPSTWVIMHDIQTRHGNIDHLVVGPGGVFLLDSKRWSGTVEVHNETARTVRWQGAPPSPLSGAAHVASLARETHDQVLANTRINQWVQPVVVVWGDFPQGIAGGQRCSYVAGEQLAKWLIEHPAQIADKVVPRIVAAIRAASSLG